MEPTSRAARYLTLRDYLRVLRHYRVAIVLIALVGTGAGLLDAKRQKPVYQTTASVAFQDPAQNINLVGFGSSNVQAPAQLALENSETITRPQVIAQVQHDLRPTGSSVQSLSGAISSQVSTAGLLDISASASTPFFAAQLANEVAQVLVSQSNQQTQTSFAAVARNTRRQIATLSRRSRSPLAASQLAFYEDELARIDTLTKFDHSAHIGQLAQQPTSPVSPKPVRSAIIGLILGLLLAIGLAFLRDSMDRRLRNSHDVEASFHFPILGHVRDQMMGRIAHTANSTGDQKVDLEAFRIIRRNIEFLNLDSPPRSIVVTSAVPEEGKTTVAGSLAFAMASAGNRTLLVDCDLRRPALGGRLEIEQTPGISDFLAGEASPEEILRPLDFSEPPSLGTGANGNGASPMTTNETSRSLVCIPAGSPTSHAAELLGSNRFREFLEQVVEVYDFVVIDSSPLLPVADTLEMLPHVEGVVLCARELKTTREEARAARTALSRFPERPTGVVVTGVKPNREHDELYSYTYSYS